MKKYKFYICRGIACVDKTTLMSFIDAFNLVEEIHKLSYDEIKEKEIELPDGDYMIRFAKGLYDYIEIHNTAEKFVQNFDKNMTEAIMFNAPKIIICHSKNEDAAANEIARFSSKFLFGKDLDGVIGFYE